MWPVARSRHPGALLPATACQRWWVGGGARLRPRSRVSRRHHWRAAARSRKLGSARNAGGCASWRPARRTRLTAPGRTPRGPGANGGAVATGERLLGACRGAAAEKLLTLRITQSGHRERPELQGFQESEIGTKGQCRPGLKIPLADSRKRILTYFS